MRTAKPRYLASKNRDSSAPVDTLTIVKVRAQLGDRNIVLRNTGSELRVNFKGGSEATAYYTDDLTDALKTGLAMASERDAGTPDPVIAANVHDAKITQVATSDLDYLIRKAHRDADEVRDRFVKSCTDLARQLTEAAASAKADDYVSTTVMSSSLVQTITALAAAHREIRETLIAVRNLRHFAK